MPSAPRAPRHSVNAFQAVALLMAFLLVAGIGGLLTAGLLMPAVAAVGTTSGAAQKLFDDLPTELAIAPPSEQSQILTKDGAHMATFYAENREVVKLDQISPHMLNAVVATEDQRFFTHGGIDPEGLMRAVLETLKGNTQGASTLTQQYIKNVLIEKGLVSGDEAAIEDAKEADGAEGINRKLREMKLAISLEKVYTKDEILEGYLNIAQFSISAYGVEAASKYYFGHGAAEMTPAEAALVAGVTKSPALYDPARGEADNYKTATDRRDTVLMQMRDQGYITPEEHDAAVATPVIDMLHITPTPVGCSATGINAYFCEYVTNVLLKDGYLGATEQEARDALRRGGLTITTTLDSARQQMAYDSLVGQVPVNDPTYRSRDGGRSIDSSLSSVEPGTGNIVAMVQNTDYGDPTDESPRSTKVNWNVDKKYGGGVGFQTGSTFKAFVLTQWLIEGHSLSESVNGDNGQTFPFNRWKSHCEPDSIDPAPWGPKNLESAKGNMSVLQATKLSANLAFVNMATQMDLCDLADTAERMGVHVGNGTVGTANPDLAHQADNPLYISPGMVLGSNSIAPLTMAAAFATFANNGTFCEPRAITQISDRDGNPIPVKESVCNEAIAPEVAAGVTHALQNVVKGGSSATGYRANIDRPAAGKTGTANNAWQSWFVGYVPQLATAVWTGHADRNTSMERVTVNGRSWPWLFGGSAAAMAWSDYNTLALEGVEKLNFPEAAELQIYGERVSVPRVGGKSVNGATETLRNAGFQVTVGEGRYSATVAAGAIAETSPGSGARVTVGANVVIYPSLGPEPAPEPTPDPNAPIDPNAPQDPNQPQPPGDGNNGDGNNGGGND